MTIDERWEKGISHNPKSIKLANEIARIDYENGDMLALEFGGDGDNGEQLLYILDIIFEEDGH